jgi:hypothetical protein
MKAITLAALVTLSLAAACAQPAANNASSVASASAGDYQTVKIDWTNDATLSNNLLTQCDDTNYAGAIFSGQVPAGGHIKVKTSAGAPQLACDVVSKNESSSKFSYKVDADDGCTVTIDLFDTDDETQPSKEASFDFGAC